MKLKLTLSALSMAVLAGCVSTSNSPQDIDTAYNSINDAQLRAHIKTLASDEFGGRAPSTKGEELTLAYLTKHFKALGYQPGNGNSFLQEVPLVSLEADPNMTLTIGGKNYEYKKDMVMGSSVSVNSSQSKIQSWFLLAMA